MKTFALNVSQVFLSYHPRKKEPTDFVAKILEDSKKHTVRANYEYWRNIADMVNRGVAELKVTTWSGRPYRSPKMNVTTFNKIGIQKFCLKMRKKDKSFAIAYVDNRMLLPDEFTTFCANDGLTVIDGVDWLKKDDFEGVVIHFNDYFKY